jgi:TPR repeat protein
MLGGAIGIAAGVAFTVMNALQQPRIGAAPSRETPAKAPILSTAALGSLAQIGTARANVQPDAVASSPASPVLAAAQANTEINAAPSAPLPPVVTAAAPAAPTMPQAAAPPAPARPSVPLARDEVATLMKRGQDLLAAGDIASARLILARLAASGEADAALLLAGTYDAAELAKARFVGAVPDAVKARAWYERAAEQGSQEARRRLQQSALR